MGYFDAGFRVVGVDIKPMPRYPFEFHQADALEYCREHGAEFDAIHASPPCKHYTMMQHIRKNSQAHPDLVAPTRETLIKTGRPYVIENVYGAPLKDATLMLCGTMFGLRIIRHRYFEVPFMALVLLPTCDHSDVFDPYHGRNGRGRKRQNFCAAMDIDWMPLGGGGIDGKSRDGTLDQAIPPAYTEFIGAHLMQYLSH